MIRNFLYLDEEKMYSLSSQIFEGITEYVLNENSESKEDSETQKGPVGSGRILADVIKKSSKSTEKKFLHDYSYSIFEKHLLDEEKVLCVSNEGLEKIKDSIDQFAFIKITAKAVFSDVEKLNELLDNFNLLGEALLCIEKHDEFKNLKAEFSERKSQTKDKKEKLKLDSEYKKLTDLSKLVKKEDDKYYDPKYLESFSFLTKYGFSDQFEIQQNTGEVLYTSCLKREFLREKEDLLIKKYSRKTEKEIVIFGLITQAFSPTIPKTVEEDAEHPNMKAALIDFIEDFTDFESSLSGKLDNEIVIDPIAAYIEL